MSDDLVCTNPNCNNPLCVHFTRMCPLCSLSRSKPESESELPVCNYQCFYCLVAGNQDFRYDDGVTFEEVVDHGRSAYKIGYRDGYNANQLPEVNCSAQGLKNSYMDGYDAGKTKRDLEKRTKAFCTLLPDFLAKTE